MAMSSPCPPSAATAARTRFMLDQAMSPSALGPMLSNQAGNNASSLTSKTLKAREPKRWKIETSSCLQTLKDGSNFQTSGSSNASGGCGEQQTLSRASSVFRSPKQILS